MGTALDKAVLQRRDLYQSRFGFPAEIDAESGAITVLTGVSSGLRPILLYSELGREILPALSKMDYAVPVISGERPDSDGRRHWQILARATDHDIAWYQLFGRTMERMRIDVRFWPSPRVALPMPGDPRRVWIDTPQPELIPPYTELADALCHIISVREMGAW